MSYEMSAEQLSDVFALDSRERYEQFFSDVQAIESLWILEDEEENILVVHPDEDTAFLPVWTHRAFAESFSDYEDRAYKPLRIGMDKFVHAWLPVLNEDDIKVGVLPNLHTSAWVMRALDLKSELEDVLEEPVLVEKSN